MSAAKWRKSSFSFSNSNCLEYRVRDGQVQLRNSRDHGQGVLTLTPGEWRAFMKAARAGEFDLPAG